MPGGVFVGVRAGSNTRVRTVSAAEYSVIRRRILNGAFPYPSPSSYNGTWYLRRDGSIVGERISPESGPTLDVIRSSHPAIRANFKVHTR